METVEGFRPEYRPSINIEGEPISPFREITIDEADPVDLWDITWTRNQAGFYVVGVNPFELEEDIKQHAGTYHEIGHVLIVDCGFDAALLRAAVELERKHLPAVAMSLAYGIDLGTR